MPVQPKPTVQRPDDPWEWDVEQAAHELVRITGIHAVGEAFRAHRIDGACLLTAITKESLKTEVGIIPIETREVILKQVMCWRARSECYAVYAEGGNQRRMNDRLKGLVEDYRLQQEFKRVIWEVEQRRVTGWPGRWGEIGRGV